MRASLFGIFLLVFCQSVFATAKIEHWQTKHGGRVYFVRTESLPLADIVIAFDAGSARDGSQYGLSSLTADLLVSGAGRWDADEIAKRLESVGAVFGAGASSDMAQASLRTLTEKPLFDKALATLQEILAKPSFKEADFQREKKRTLAALKQREESPGDLASLEFYQTVYGNHPYAHPEEGTIKTVSKLTVKDLRRFYQQYYVASNAMVVIVGDLSREEAEATAEKLLAHLPVGSKPEPLPDVAMPTKATTLHREFPSTQTHVMVGMPGIERKDPDYFSLYVGNHILGGGGLVSKLFDEIREKRGLAYSASSAFIPMVKKGPFLLSLQTRNDQTPESLKVLNQTLADFINNGPTEAELTAAKKNITGGFAMRFDTNKKLANIVSMIGFNQLPLDYLDTYQASVDQVTIASITDAFKRHVDLNLLQTVTVGNSTPRKSEK